MIQELQERIKIYQDEIDRLKKMLEQLQEVENNVNK